MKNKKILILGGTGALGNTLTTHTGTVVSFDSTKKILTTTFEDVIRFTLETNDEEGIALERKSTLVVLDNAFYKTL